MRDDRPSLFRITPQVVLGLLVVAFGLTLTAENMGFVRAGDVWRFWPLALVAIGAAKLLQTGQRSGQVFGVVLILVGLSISADEFWAIRIDISRYWPLALVALGLLIVSRAWRGPQAGGGLDARNTTSDASLSEFAFWSAVKRRVSSPAFRRADLTAVMGGIELDLRPAGTGGAEAVIDVFAMWGGIEIIVPPDWDVSNRIVPIMGGAEDKSSGTQDSKHRLVLRGFVVMGGVEIKT
jgi:LiaF transmembrane domain